MNRVLKLAVKDLRVLFRDKLATFFIIGFPIMMGLFFGIIFQVGPSGGSKSKMKVLVVNQDDSEMASVFVDALKKNKSLDVQSLEEKAIDEFAKEKNVTRNEAAVRMASDSVRLGKHVGMMVVPPGFGETAGLFWEEPPEIQVGIDPSRTAEGAMMEGFVMEAIGSLFAKRFQNPDTFLPSIESAREALAGNNDVNPAERLLVAGFFDSVEKMISSASDLQSENQSGPFGESDGNGMSFANVKRIDVVKQVDPNSTRGQLTKIRSRWDISFPQAMMWGVLSCVSGFCISIARERAQGTMVRLQVAPLSKFEILLGKALACFFAVLLVVTFMTILGIFLGMNPASYPKLIFSSVCLAIAFVGIMMTMSVLGKTEESVSGAGWAINMVMAMLGGCMIPVMFMPDFLQTISVISPIRWALMAIEGSVWREYTWGQLLIPCGILVGVGALGLAIGTSILQRRTD